MAQPTQGTKQKTGMVSSAQQKKPKVSQNTNRIRGPGLKVLVKRAEGVSYRKALELADKENLVLAPNKRLTKALVETDEWKSMREAFACWSGTMIGYKESGKKLGKFIEYTDPEDGQKYVFPVPEQYRTEKNMVLVVEHPDFSLVQDGKNLVVETADVAGLTHFPKESGWHLGDEEYDIPCGKKVSRSDKRARYLWRIERRVGPVARVDYYFDDYDRQYVYAYYGSSGCFGVVVESPEGDAAKIEGPTEQKIVLEIPENIPGNLRALMEKFSGEKQVEKLKELPRKELLKIAQEFAQVFRNSTLKG